MAPQRPHDLRAQRSLPPAGAPEDRDEGHDRGARRRAERVRARRARRARCRAGRSRRARAAPRATRPGADARTVHELRGLQRDPPTVRRRECAHGLREGDRQGRVRGRTRDGDARRAVLRHPRRPRSRPRRSYAELRPAGRAKTAGGVEIRRAGLERDPLERERLYDAASYRLSDQAPGAWLSWSEQWWLVSPKVRGYELSAFDPDFAQLSLARLVGRR